MLTTTEQVWTVSQITREIKSLLENRLSSIWIEGEISNFKTASSGHSYFTLKDEFSQIQAIIFRLENARLSFQIENGQKLICHGRLNVYDKGGTYSLVIDAVEVKGKGALQLKLEQLKAKLQKEGLFEVEHKRPIPTFPQSIGIVTSPTGAAIRDILNVIRRRFKGVHLILVPVPVQGEGAAKKIAEAIENLNLHGKCEVLIVGRGGGSLEDLWSFNEEIVARAIFNSQIPVISAVGHEIDWTIADFVADLRAPTPSAAAELVIAEREQLENTLEEWQLQMKRAMERFLSDHREVLDTFKESYVFQKVRERIERHYQESDELLRRLQSDTLNLIQSKKQEFENFTGRLEALSPLAILKRGYSVTFLKSGELAKNTSELQVGDSVFTKLGKGNFESRVTKINEVNDGNSEI